MSAKERFDQFWSRLSRATPVLGLAASLAFLPARLQREADDDAAYRRLVAQLGAAPLFPHHSMAREKIIIGGEILGHLAALIVGVALWRNLARHEHAFFAIWAVAFFADWIGGKVGLWIFKRRQPSVDEIVGQAISQERSESDQRRD
jgi:hypothetical protein